MGIIYKEMVSYRKASFFKGVLLLVFIILTANLLVNSVHYSNQYNVELEILLLSGGAVAIGVLVQSYNMIVKSRISYMYKLIDRELIFERVIGSGRKVILSIDMKHVELFVHALDAGKAKGVDRTYKFMCCSSRKKAYCCVVNDNGKRVKVIFQPSQDLVKKLELICQNKCSCQTA